jgi:predicted ATP-grasp superfamily ATP-dependent carboligase
MLQEFIPGDDTHGVNYNSFFLNGEPKIEITAEKVRLSPPLIGFPRVVVSKHIPQVIEPGRKMLKATGYNGFSCMEFKKDSRDGIYKLMEVNGRHNLSTPLSVKSGINFPFLTYMHIVYGELSEVNNGFKEGIYWIDLGKDIIESIRSFRKEHFSILEYIKPYLKPKVFTIPSIKDPLPLLHRTSDIIYAILKYAKQKSLNKRK